MFTQNGFETFQNKFTAMPKVADIFKLLIGLCVAMAMLGAPLYLIGMPGPVALGISYIAYIAKLMHDAFTSDAHSAYEAYDQTLANLEALQVEIQQLNAKLDEAYDASEHNANKALDYKGQLERARQGNQHTATTISKLKESLAEYKNKLNAAPTKKDMQAAALLGWSDHEKAVQLKRAIAAKRGASVDASDLEQEQQTLLNKYESLKRNIK
jgi:small-conductance mechanosensitive channel